LHNETITIKSSIFSYYYYNVNNSNLICTIIKKTIINKTINKIINKINIFMYQCNHNYSEYNYFPNIPNIHLFI